MIRKNKGVSLGLDLGTKTGWAIGTKEHGVSSSGAYNNLSLRKGAKSRFFVFYEFLYNLHEERKLAQVFFEDVDASIHAGKIAAQVYGGFKGVLQSFCDACNIPLTGFAVHSIKKSTTGKSNADKIEMMNAIRQQGYQVKTHDEADAIAILIMGIKND